MTTRTELDYRSYWKDGYTWNEYLENEVEEHEDLWKGLYRRHETPRRAHDRIAEIGGEWRLLVLTEDWCGDASNIVPVIARFAEAAPNVELRLVKRDENLELMDEFLTNGGRAIPMVVILGADFGLAGHWGPRPRELQEFVISEKEKGDRPFEEIYKDARKWYARDDGETTLEELLDEIEAAGKP